MFDTFGIGDLARLTTDGQLITFSPPIVSMEGSSDVIFLASGTRADTAEKKFEIIILHTEVTTQVLMTTTRHIKTLERIVQ